MPGIVLVSAFFHGLVQKEWQSPDGAFNQHLLDLHWLHPPPLYCTRLTGNFHFHKYPHSIRTRVAVPVALCTDVDVWHMVALVLWASSFIHCQCPDVSWNAHSLPLEIDAV